MTAPIVFNVNGKQMKFPSEPAMLPGLSPAAVDVVLETITRYNVDPKSVDIVAANMASAKFAVEVSTYAVAETLRRMDGARDITTYLEDLRSENDFDTVAEAFKTVALRNEKVFGKQNAAMPAEPAPGN